MPSVKPMVWMSVSSEKLTETAAESCASVRARSSASNSVPSEEASMAAMLGRAMRRISGATGAVSRSVGMDGFASCR